MTLKKGQTEHESMSNTYTDNPARGLSKLQKSILLWVKSGYEDYIAMGYAGMVTGDSAHGVPWSLRPTFYGEAATLSFTGGTARGRRGNKAKRKQSGEAPAVSRALKRLEERGLVKCRKYDGRTSGVSLTPEGEELVKRLTQENYGRHELTVLETEHEREHGD